MFDMIKTPEQLEQEKTATLSAKIRDKRNRLLKETDYLMMSDYPGADKSAFKTYRQALRDITKQPGFPEYTEWPEMP